MPITALFAIVTSWVTLKAIRLWRSLKPGGMVWTPISPGLTIAACIGFINLEEHVEFASFVPYAT